MSEISRQIYLQSGSNTLILSYLSLSSLRGIERSPKVNHLDIKNNNISLLSELLYLSSLPELRELEIEGNPVCRLGSAIELIRAICPSIVRIDSRPTSSDPPRRVPTRNFALIFSQLVEFEALKVF